MRFPDPARHNFALFRAGAAILRRILAAPATDDTRLIIRDRHQSAVETWMVSLWVLAMTTCYLSEWLFDEWPLPLALLTAAMLTPALVQIPVFISGLLLAPLVRRGGSNIAINSFFFMSLLAAASIYFALGESWLRFVGRQFLMLAAANGVAAVVLALAGRGGAQSAH